MNIKHSRRALHTAVYLATASSFWNATAHATTDSWQGVGADSLWTDGSNWSTNTQPGSGDSVVFNGNGNSNTSVDLGGNTENVTSVVFSGTPSAYTIGVTTGDTLSFANNGSISVGPLTTSTYSTANGGATQTIKANIIDNGSLTFNDAVAGTELALNGAISGSGSVLFSGGTTDGGSILLNGNNIYSGGTSIAANGSGSNITTVLIGSNAAFGSGQLTMNAGGGSQDQLEAYGNDGTISNNITLAYGFTIANAATPHNLAFTGPIAFGASARTLTFYNYGQTFNLGSSQSPSTLTLPTGSGTAEFVVSSNSTAGNAVVVINDVIQDPGGVQQSTSLQYGDNGATNKYMPGGTIVIKSQNTYAEPTIFQWQSTQPVVEVGTSSVGNPLSISSGPFGKGSVTTDDTTSAGAAVPIILEPYGGDQTVANAFVLTVGLFVGNAPTSGNTGAIDTTGVPHNLTLTGTISNPGKVITNNLASSVGLYLGNATFSSSALTITGATATFQSQTNTSTTYIYDQITGPGSIVFKEGGTYQLLSNSNNYQGATTINGGTVLALNTVSGSSATGGGAISVTGSGAIGSGGVLGGTGYITGLVTVGSATGASYGGVIAPGPGSAGSGTNTSTTLNVASAIFNPYGRYVVTYNGTDGTPGANGNSLILGTGSLDLSDLTASAPFDLNLNAVVAGGAASYTLATFAAGIFTGGVEYASGTDVTNLFTISGAAPPFTPDLQVIQNLDGSESLDVFAATPEPSSLGLLGVMGMLLSRRTRQSIAGPNPN